MAEMDYSKLEEQLRVSEESCSRLLGENEGLQKTVEEQARTIEIAKSVPATFEGVRMLFARYLVQITPDNRHSLGNIGSLGNPRKETPRIDFESWQLGTTGPLKAENKELREFAFETSLQLLMKISKLNQRPFVYFDFANRGVFYTPSTLEFLEIPEEGVSDFPLFLNYVGKSGKRGLLNSLKVDARDEKNIKWDYVETTTVSGFKIKMANFPFVYRGRAVGVGTLFPGPNYSSWRLRPYKKAVETVAGVYNDLGKIQGESK